MAFSPRALPLLIYLQLAAPWRLAQPGALSHVASLIEGSARGLPPRLTVPLVFKAGVQALQLAKGWLPPSREQPAAAAGGYGAVPSRATELLLSWRRGSCYDEWAAAYAAAIKCLLQARERLGAQALRTRHGALIEVLCTEASSPDLARALLAMHWEKQGSAACARKALQLAHELLTHVPGGFAAAACSLLRPDANCPIAVRLEAIKSA